MSDKERDIEKIKKLSGEEFAKWAEDSFEFMTREVPKIVDELLMIEEEIDKLVKEKNIELPKESENKSL